MKEKNYDYGVIGLGTMGRNLVYNICDNGFKVAGFDKDESQIDTLEKEKTNYEVLGALSIEEFVSSLVEPRVILLLVPAGKIVDVVIDELIPLISKNDIIMDCGNSHFTDTDRRINLLSKNNIHFMGVGVSGGESGARYGPSIMPGGAKEAYEHIATMLKAISAKVNSEPCVAYIGDGSSGHYVKMVHNGIEYALMQLIAETYHMLKEYAGLSNEELQELFSKWNSGRLQSYLLSITAQIFTQKDTFTSNDLVDMILDTAHQKGTGMWVSQNAMDLQLPIPAIDAAVSARDLSALKNERVSASKVLKGPERGSMNDKITLVTNLEQAFYFAMIITYSQGFSLMDRASKEYKYNLRLDEIAKIWRGGCIIRASVLENIRSAFALNPSLSNLMLEPELAGELISNQEGIREIIKIAVDNGIPAPAFMASLSYYDGYRKEWLPSNLLQAQRDFFGAHTYQRIDSTGDFHTLWNQIL